MRRLLADRQLSSARLNVIDEAVIDAYKQRRTRQASQVWAPLSARLREPGTGHAEAFIPDDEWTAGSRDEQAAAAILRERITREWIALHEDAPADKELVALVSSVRGS